MKTHRLIRWSGLAAIAGGVLNAVVSFAAPAVGSPLEWGFFLGGIANQFGLIGIYAFQVEGSGAMGLLGFLLAMVGNAYFTGGEPSIGGVDSTAVFGSIFALGLLLLAVGTLKAGKLPRWAPVMWILAVLVGLPGAFVASLESLSFQLGAVAFGLGFIGAGYGLWSPVRAMS